MKNSHKEKYVSLAPIFLDCGIKIFYLEEGQDCWELAEKMALAISQIGIAATFDVKANRYRYNPTCLELGLMHCQSLVFSNSWKKENLVMISDALQEAADLEEIIEPTFLLTAQILRKPYK